MWTKFLSDVVSHEITFDLNYVGCEHASKVVFFPILSLVWSELCGMWTWSRANGLCLLGKVWSELCGMWTNPRALCSSKRARVWSELCGMWTRIADHNWKRTWKFDLNYVGCELRVISALCGLSKKFDLNYVGCEQDGRYYLDEETVILLVWSELCGMWTTTSRSWTLITNQFDLNYVGCEQEVQRLKTELDKRLIWTMWDVNIQAGDKNRSLCEVWSELCGMWTWFDRYNCDFGYRVWSELCGMWTLSFAEVW